MPDSTRQTTTPRAWLTAMLLLFSLTSLAADQEPDGSLKAPYTDEVQTAEGLVERLGPAFKRAVDYTDGEPVLVVGYTETISSRLAMAVREGLSTDGRRQVAGGSWLRMLHLTQDRFQTAGYTPRPRAELASANLMLALDREQAAPGLSRIRAALITLRPLESDDGSRFEPGELIPGSAVTLYLGVLPPGWNENSLADNASGKTIRGSGYCNRNLPPNRWRYSALLAAELSAKANLLAKREGEAVDSHRETSSSGLRADTVAVRSSGRQQQSHIVSNNYDPETCRAEVVMATGGGYSATDVAEIDGWWSRISKLFPLLSLLL